MPLMLFPIPWSLFGLPWPLILCVVGVLALWAIIATCREKLRKYRTRDWPTAPGTLSNLESKKVDGGLNGVDYWKITFDYTYQAAQSHAGKYSFNCTSETMAQGALAGMKTQPVCVHYSPTDEGKSLLWEDEIWDIWWDTYWAMTHSDPPAN